MAECSRKRMLDPRNVLLIRYGEIGLKGENRGTFESLLIRHIEHVLREVLLTEDESWRIRKTYGRLFIEGLKSLNTPISALAKVPGIVALNPSVMVAHSIDQVVEQGIMLAKEALSELRERKTLEQKGHKGVTFKVSSRRQMKSFPMESPEIEKLLGEKILLTQKDLSVDLHNPDFILNVEVRDEGTYLYWREIRGPGGLPCGSAGRGLLLISGGIDSPVAGYMAIKRGIQLDALHFWSFPHTSERAKDKVIDLSHVLQQYNPWLRLYVAHFTEIQTEILRVSPEKFRVLIMRRMMMRVASGLAKKLGALTIVTGEDLGQVASQTLESLTVIEEAQDLLVLRPLIGFDKEETVRLARSLGTYDLSCLPYEDCCTVFTPRHPATKPRLKDILEAEKDLPIDDLVKRCLDTVELVIPSTSEVS